MHLRFTDLEPIYYAEKNLSIVYSINRAFHCWESAGLDESAAHQRLGVFAL